MSIIKPHDQKDGTALRFDSRECRERLSEALRGNESSEGEPAGQPDALNSAASNESVRTGGAHPKGVNHRRGTPQRGPTQDTQTERAYLVLEHVLQSNHTTKQTGQLGLKVLCTPK